MIAADYDATARLLLMDKPRGLIEFHRAFLEVHPEAAVRITSELWGKYRGYDGRTLPTHDYISGKRLGMTP